MTLLAAGDRKIIKFGSAGPEVRRVQRTLNAAALGKPVKTNGVFDSATNAAVRTWQAKVGLRVSGVISAESWDKLGAGARSKA
jgi:peptidoglycan hydrolase-like protein with peptidoglycan-binding domain